MALLILIFASVVPFSDCKCSGLHSRLTHKINCTIAGVFHHLHCFPVDETDL